MSALSISSINKTGLASAMNASHSFAALDVIADVLDPRVAQLAVAQPRHRIVFIKALQRLGGRFDVPFDQRRAQRLGDFQRQDGFAGPRFPLYQEGALERDCGVNRNFQIIGGDVAAGAFKTHETPSGGGKLDHSAKAPQARGLSARACLLKLTTAAASPAHDLVVTVMELRYKPPRERALRKLGAGVHADAFVQGQKSTSGQAPEEWQGRRNCSSDGREILPAER
jgi:hypothetical protein